ncbi:MAG: hypothetical protein EA404_06445 [Spirochaetaceae bacterium]|nr:MAG: hypothetical protein EA404_06445 [Spirochaetaceae bacterium]
MNRTITALLIFGALGLVVGYLIFARSGGSYLPIQTLLTPAEGLLGRIGEAARRVPEIRRNILLTGAAGAIGGVVVSSLRR